MSRSYLLIRQTEPVAILHMLSFFFSWEGACDQHRANQHCADKDQGFCILLEQEENSSFKL
ncbi:unnamed protein product [Staurois parvus]|uniref:Uncharacterized protein n=1 Tax=Staurois parvus TaxID=386267 RepID=A0ABN9BZ51_9NEOB|nr:unnamed protein product [Staurois parvus]